MPPEKSPEDSKYSQLKQIRTYQGDVANALENQNESIFSIHKRETEKRRATGGIPEEMREPEKDNSKKYKDFLFLFFGSIVLIAMGVLGAWFGYQEFVRRSTPPVLAVPENRFISAGSEINLNLQGFNRERFAVTFSEAISGTPAGELRHVVNRRAEGTVAPILTTTELMLMLEARAPGSLVRSFDKLYMTGAIGETPFFIIKLSSFENAFAGMLAWEANMGEDLIPLFGSPALLKAIDDKNVFKDVIVKNKDVRVLTSEVITSQLLDGEVVTSTTTTPVLLYSFLDNNMLIITNKIEALQTIMDRLTREKLSR
jgi:hypothetical protein